MGVGAGAYILGLYATQNPSHVKGLVLCSVTSSKSNWSEWSNKWLGLSGLYSWNNFFMNRWFTPDTRNENKDLIDLYEKELNSMDQSNLVKFVHGYQSRLGFTDNLKNITCPVLMVIGKGTTSEQ